MTLDSTTLRSDRSLVARRTSVCSIQSPIVGNCRAVRGPPANLIVAAVHGQAAHFVAIDFVACAINRQLPALADKSQYTSIAVDRDLVPITFVHCGGSIVVYRDVVRQ